MGDPFVLKDFLLFSSTHNSCQQISTTSSQLLQKTNRATAITTTITKAVDHKQWQRTNVGCEFDGSEHLRMRIRNWVCYSFVVGCEMLGRIDFWCKRCAILMDCQRDKRHWRKAVKCMTAS